MVYRNSKVALDRINDIKTWYFCWYWWYVSSRQHWNWNIVATIKKVRSLGFTIHAGKSNLILTQTLYILGFTVSSVAMAVSLKDTHKKDFNQRNLWNCH